MNLLAFQDEARILLDSKIAVGNTISGETSPLVSISPGPHRLQVIPRRGPGQLLTADFTITAGMSTTLVIAGGPESLVISNATGNNTPPALIPLVTPLQMARQHPALGGTGKASEAVCTLIFANCDLRGSLKISLKAADQTRTLELKPKAFQMVEGWPVAPLDLKVSAQFKTPAGANVISQLNLFTPPGPGTYFCILLGQKYDAVRSFYLSATVDGDLGRSPDDVR